MAFSLPCPSVPTTSPAPGVPGFRAFPAQEGAGGTPYNQLFALKVPLSSST